MTNEELMQLMTDMGLHEGGIENWVPDNAWLRVANAVEDREREACAKVCEDMRPSQKEFDQRFFTACTLNAAAIRARGETK